MTDLDFLGYFGREKPILKQNFIRLSKILGIIQGRENLFFFFFFFCLLFVLAKKIIRPPYVGQYHWPGTEISEFNYYQKADDKIFICKFSKNVKSKLYHIENSKTRRQTV